MIEVGLNSKEVPQDLEYTPRLVLNVLINGIKGNLGPFTVEKIIKYSDLEREEVDAAIKELAKRDLVTLTEWV